MGRSVYHDCSIVILVGHHHPSSMAWAILCMIHYHTVGEQHNLLSSRQRWWPTGLVPSGLCNTTPYCSHRTGSVGPVQYNSLLQPPDWFRRACAIQLLTAATGLVPSGLCNTTPYCSHRTGSVGPVQYNSLLQPLNDYIHVLSCLMIALAFSYVYETQRYNVCIYNWWNHSFLPLCTCTDVDPCQHSHSVHLLL